MPADEIRQHGYDLSFKRYFDRPHEEEEREAPQLILDRIIKLNEEIASEISDIEALLA